jgi:hypothetical protein
MKIQSVKVLTTGQGQRGPWTLVEATFEGQNGVYKGFYYETPLVVGQEVDVEFSNEEYKGNMEARFKLVSQKKASSGVTEMAIKTEIARYGQEIIRKLDLIMEELKMRDFKAEVEAIRNEEPKVPTWEQTPPPITDEDVPF